jgi:hypothetical protein
MPITLAYGGQPRIRPEIFLHAAATTRAKQNRRLTDGAVHRSLNDLMTLKKPRAQHAAATPGGSPGRRRGCRAGGRAGKKLGREGYARLELRPLLAMPFPLAGLVRAEARNFQF